MPPSSVSKRSRARLREVYLLSPANLAGERAKMLLNPRAGFDLAVELRQKGAALGDVFSFCSSLYFRGKLAYSRRFCPPLPEGITCVITPNRGLIPPDVKVTTSDILAFGQTDVDADNPEYRKPLEQHAHDLKRMLRPEGRVILLGSIASEKYRDVLLPVFGEQLHFPPAFVGRGDMSRGGLLLRHAKAGVPLEFAPVVGATLRGRRVSRGFPGETPSVD
jgi:hypothetical protein